MRGGNVKPSAWIVQEMRAAAKAEASSRDKQEEKTIKKHIL